MASGHVTYVDGSPAPGVAVTNGNEVTSTDEDGQFEVNDDGRFTVLTRPNGWTAKPWFRPPGENPADFVLLPAPTTSPFRFAHVTDLHLSARDSVSGMEVPDTPEPVADAIEWMLSAHEGVSVIVATGDLTDTGLETEYELVNKALEAIPVEVVALPGNHDHMAGEPRFFVNERGYGTNRGVPGVWEGHFGPRWFSLDRGGLHIVVVDWHMWELGIDRDIQDRWVAADLAHHKGKPWVLFTHDQMPGEFFEGLPEPVATFSGHWHTSRTVRVGSTTHYNIPPFTFAGLDYSRPGAVIADWDGSTMEVKHHESPLAPTAWPASSPEWSLRIGPHGGLAGPVALNDRVACAATWDDETGEGSVVAVEISSGTQLWRTRMARAVKSTPVVSGERVIVADIAAGVVAMDAADGSVLWQTDPVTPLRTWCWTSPVIADGQVVVSTPTRVAAHRLADGDLVWERIGLVPHCNLLSHSSPVIVGGTVVVGFWPFTPAYFGLDVATGDTLWEIDDPQAGPIEGATGRGTALGPWSPVGAGVAASSIAVFPASAGWAGIDVSRGEFLWRSPDEGRFRPGRPVLVGNGVVVTDPDRVKCLGLGDGAVEWSVTFPTGEGVALAPYRSTPHMGTAGAGLVGDVVIVPGLDGALHRLDPASGADLGRLDIGLRSAATPLVIGDLVILGGIDGTLLALPRDEVAT